MNSTIAVGDEERNQSGFYLGAFGGVSSSSSSTLEQDGKVFLNAPHPVPFLPINAQGPTTASGQIPVGGLHLGYEWDFRRQKTEFQFKPAVELEGLYIGKHTPLGQMPVHPTFLGTQYVTVPMTAGMLFANSVLTLQTPYSDRLLPYLGGGVGLAFVSIKVSDSANPSEPGINHFNSDPDASDIALALQFKAGIKFAVTQHWHLFVEYRYLSIHSTRYTFGATDYPGLHLPTDTWDVDMGRQEYNIGVAGLQYKF